MSEALLRLRSLVFEGAGSYRQPTGLLPLANQGRVLICGPEGSGKSMVPEVSTLVLFGKGSPRMRATGLVESSIVNKDTGYQAKLTFDSGFGVAARHVDIEQAFKHKRAGSRYVITIDGARDLTVNKPEQKKLVKRLVPLSYAEWLGVVYLAQNGIHDLLLGTPSQKRAYLTSVFGLDFYDDLLTEAQEELKRLLKEAEGALDLEQQLADVRADLKKAEAARAELPERAQVEAGIKKLDEKRQALSRRSDGWRPRRLRSSGARPWKSNWLRLAACPG
jgi:DNA repair exonuclease SbcCD ATPase subunit